MRDFLECRAFVEHLRSEHKRIQQAVGDVKRDLEATSSASEPARLREDLRRLRKTLVEHFAEEDGGGCLEEAVSCAPHLASDADRIEKEHASILTLIDRLVARSDDCNAEDFRESFRSFAKVLQAHESAENRLLQDAFGTGEFETYDSPPTHGE